MELDTKQKVLLTVYVEYQKDLPDFEKALTSANMGMPNGVIYTALRKLQYEELITEYETRTADGRVGSSLQRIMMTRQGIEYVENKLKIEPKDTGEEKVKTIIEKTATWGWEQIKDIASKALADILKG